MICVSDLAWRLIALLDELSTGRVFAIGGRNYWTAAMVAAAKLGSGIAEATPSAPSVLTRPSFDMGRSRRGPPTGMLSARTVSPRPGCVKACAVLGAGPAAASGAAAAATGFAADMLALCLCRPNGRDLLRPQACRAPECSAEPVALSPGVPRQGVANAGTPKGLAAANGAIWLAATGSSMRLRGVAAHDVEAMDGVSDAVPVEPELLRVPSCHTRGGLPASMLGRRRCSGSCLAAAVEAAQPAAVRY